MTKRDIKYVAIGGTLGFGALLAFWYLRRSRPIPEISPAAIRWELP